jgi:RNA polymerase sigma-70 factor (ECF subfamily)
MSVASPVPEHPERAARGGTPGARTAEALLEAVGRDRDRLAFAQLFREYGPRLKGFLARRVDPGTADEMVQEVMLALWRKAHQFDADRGNASTWIFTIARNALFSHLRQAMRPEVDPTDPECVRQSRLPDEQLDSLREQAAVSAAMHSLPVEQLQVIRGAYLQGQSLSEVASAHQLPLGTVKTRARLALERLRRMLGAGDEP